MDQKKLYQILNSIASGSMTTEDAMKSIKHISFEDIQYAHIDHNRSLRKGFPEVIFGQGKTSCQIIGIMEKMILQENIVLVTRIEAKKAEKVISRFPHAKYHKDARMIIWGKKQSVSVKTKGIILVLSAGTSDIPVAKEAYLTAKAMGNNVEFICDVGVAGIHRLYDHMHLINRASVLIVVAGMEGALPSVVAGMVSRPVLAVPTSIGYGVSLGGIAALFSMLNSCSSNVAVVNIDNGFGAGYMASTINRQ